MALLNEEMATDSAILQPTDEEPQVEQFLPDDEAALKLVEDTYRDYAHGRKPFEREWYRSILFYLGNQWIIWDTTENKWRKKRLADWIPTPVTNRYASTGERLKSVLARIEPNWNFTPSTSGEDDVASAKIATDIVPVILEENKILRIRESVASWLTFSGNAYLLSGVEGVFAPDAEAAAAEDDEESPIIGSEIMAGVNEEAPPRVPTDYTLYTDVVSPFEAYLDQTIEHFEDQTKFLIVQRRSKEYVKNLWDIDVEELDSSPNIHYQESIGYITNSPEITGFLASMSRIKRVTVKRLFSKPSKKYPYGLYIVIAGDKVVEKKYLPQTAKGDPFIPVAPVKFDNIPAAAFGRTPMADLIYKQVQRNKIESLIELIILRMASPVWLMPEGTYVRNFSGAPGAIITYQGMTEKSKEPSRIPGEQVPSSVVMFLAQIDKDFEELAATFEALKGQTPYSGAPGIVIEQLVEQGLTRFGPALRNVAEGYRTWMQHQIEFYRNYVGTRTRTKKSELSQWAEQKFMGSDIKGAVNVQIDSDSTVPRSSQVETAKVLGAMGQGLVDASDPIVRQKILRKLHIEDLRDDIEADMVRAVQENEQMLAGQPVAATPFIDNHPVHIYQHRKFANTDEGSNPQIRPIIAKHLAQHHMMLDAESNPGASAPGGPGVPPPGGAPMKAAAVGPKGGGAGAGIPEPPKAPLPPGIV
jgi:hypothetical protein